MRVGSWSIYILVVQWNPYRKVGRIDRRCWGRLKPALNPNVGSQLLIFAWTLPWCSLHIAAWSNSVIAPTLRHAYDIYLNVVGFDLYVYHYTPSSLIAGFQQKYPKQWTRFWYYNTESCC